MRIRERLLRAGDRIAVWRKTRSRARYGPPPRPRTLYRVPIKPSVTLLLGAPRAFYTTDRYADRLLQSQSVIRGHLGKKSGFMRAPLKLYLDKRGKVAYAKLRIEGQTKRAVDDKLVREMVFRPEKTRIRGVTHGQMPGEIIKVRVAEAKKKAERTGRKYEPPTDFDGLKFVSDKNQHMYFVFPGDEWEIKEIYRSE
ncbi:MAG: hypothetical protein JXB14_03580 [Candidatus Altiarchaeota archaeon]|nr:hypothetical protein [Candidatus Altiarchaeota archaeon]